MRGAALRQVRASLLLIYEYETVVCLRFSTGNTSQRNKTKQAFTIGLCSGSKKDIRSSVDVCVSLTGTRGRSTWRRLDEKIREQKVDRYDFVEYFRVEIEGVGDVLLVTLCVRHRSLMEDWYLRYVTIATADSEELRKFPCHSVVRTRITLRPGNGG